MIDNMLKKVKKLSERKNVPMSRIIGAVEMSEKGFYIMFKNESIKVRVLNKISQVLDVPITYFFEDVKLSPNNGNNGIYVNGSNNKTEHKGMSMAEQYIYDLRSDKQKLEVENTDLKKKYEADVSDLKKKVLELEEKIL